MYIPTPFRTLCRASIFVCAVLAAACTPARVSQMTNLPPLGHRVEAVALAPSGGVLADAIGLRLFDSGIRVMDTQQTSNLLIRANLDEFEVMQPQNLQTMREKGIDAIIMVRTVAGYDGRPESASVRVVSTHTADIVAGLSWQNGHAGQEGSMADRDARKNVVEAAEQIGKAVAQQLRRGPESH